MIWSCDEVARAKNIVQFRQDQYAIILINDRKIMAHHNENVLLSSITLMSFSNSKF